MTDHGKHPATAEDIRAIVGRLGDDRIAAILRTGATAADVTEAFTWFTTGEYPVGGRQRPLSGAVAEVYEILKPDQLDEEEDLRQA
jgi:hypothetical protein